MDFVVLFNDAVVDFVELFNGVVVDFATPFNDALTDFAPPLLPPPSTLLAEFKAPLLPPPPLAEAALALPPPTKESPLPPLPLPPPPTLLLPLDISSWALLRLAANILAAAEALFVVVVVAAVVVGNVEIVSWDGLPFVPPLLIELPPLLLFEFIERALPPCSVVCELMVGGFDLSLLLATLAVSLFDVRVADGGTLFIVVGTVVDETPS